jgi:hypothetical protein
VKICPILLETRVWKFEDEPLGFGVHMISKFIREHGRVSTNLFDEEICKNDLIDIPMRFG